MKGNINSGLYDISWTLSIWWAYTRSMGFLFTSSLGDTSDSYRQLRHSRSSWHQINDFNNSCYLDCIIPSSDKPVKDKRYSSFSHTNTEKSNSTDAVLANTVAIPLQKPAMQRTFHRQLLNQLWTSYYDRIPSDGIEADHLAGVFHEVLDDPVLFGRFGLQSMYVSRNCGRCRASTLIWNFPVRSLANSWGSTGGMSSVGRFSLSLSAWMAIIPSIIDRNRLLTA